MSTSPAPTDTPSAAERRGVKAFLLKPVRIPAVVNLAIFALVIYTLLTAHLTNEQALLIAAACLVFGAFIGMMQLAMRRRYAAQLAQANVESRRAVQRLSLGRTVWYTLGHTRAPLAYVVLVYLTIPYALLSIRFPWLP